MTNVRIKEEYVKTEVEMKVTQPQAKEFLEPLETARGKEGSSLRVLGESVALPIPGFHTSGL